MKTARRTAALVLLFAFCVLAFTISQNTGYAGTTTSVFGSTQTVHNTNIGVAGYCNDGSTCTTNATCRTNGFTDSPGANTYTNDVGMSPVSRITCLVLGHSFNIASSSSNTLTCPDTADFPLCGGAEVSGLGLTPSVEGVGNAFGNISSIATTTSCTSGDFAFAAFYGGTPVVGSGWTVIGTPSHAWIMEWQTVSSTGTVTATITGNSTTEAGSVACYKPTSANSAYQVGVFLPGP